MGASQMMLVIAGMLLLSVIILRMNTAMLYTDEITIASDTNTKALSIANSIISEASSRRFDEATTGGSSINDIALLTPIGSLGKEYGEVTSDQFDDFDDFVTVQEGIDIGGYNVVVTVNYVMPTSIDLNATSIYETFYKKMVVKVKSPMLKTDNTYDVVSATKIFGYWPEIANGISPVIVPPPSTSSTSTSTSSTSSTSTSTSSSSSGEPLPPPPPPVFLR